MWILPLLGYLGLVLGFGFLTLAIASGLYYLSELVEEHSVFTRRLLTRLIYSVAFILVLLVVVDRFPIWLSIFSIASHAIYMVNLRHFPIVKLSDPVFITSCVLVLLNHILWFRHFSAPPASYNSRDRSAYYSRYDSADVPTFTEIAAYFGICVWLVPFSLFISLSAGENVLPSMGSEYATGGVVRSNSTGALGGMGGIQDMSPDGVKEALASTARRGTRRGKGLVKVGVDWLRDRVEDAWRMTGILHGDKGRRFD